MSGLDALTGARVLNLMLGAGAGGLESMALNGHRALAGRGVQMRSIGAADGWLAGAFATAPDEFQPLPIWGRLDPTAPWRLRGMARAFGADLVLAHGSRAVTLAVRAFKGRMPIAAMVHNFRAKADLAGVDLAVCVSPAVARDVVARFPDLKAVVVENFAPLDTGPPRRPHAGAPRIGSPRIGSPRIGSLGRLHANKGYDTLLKAAALLRDRNVDFHLTIAGDGPERIALQSLTERLGLTDRTTFPGWVTDPAEMFAAIDLFVLSSVVEPFGLVVIEAMAAGVPVVASDIDGPRDILERGRWGRLVPPGDPEALAEAIGEVLADPEAARATAWAAQVRVLARYSLEAGGERLAAALCQLIR